jgi:hypothetical protein
MMLVARIAKQSGPFWSVECEPIGAFTQGVGIEDAVSMLEGLVNVMVRDLDGHLDFEARVTGMQLVEDNSYDAYIERMHPRFSQRAC